MASQCQTDAVRKLPMDGFTSHLKHIEEVDKAQPAVETIGVDHKGEREVSGLQKVHCFTCL